MSTGRWLIPERLAKGSSMMLAGLPGLFRAPDWREALSRAFVVLLFASMLVAGVALHPWLLGLLTGLWIVTALVVSRPVPGEQAGQSARQGKTENEAGLHQDDVVELLHELLGEANGVHLSRIAEQLTQESRSTWSSADVRGLLKAAGIQVRHSVRVPGLGVAVGVHRQDIPSPGLRSGPGSGVAPQVSAATATATRPTVEEVGGGAVRLIHEPGERRQYAVRRKPEELS